MKTESNVSFSKELIEEADRIYQDGLDCGQLPEFDELVNICRDQNLIAEEIRILKLAVSFYENADIQRDEKVANLSKFRSRLTAREKEAKVMELLDWKQ